MDALYKVLFAVAIQVVLWFVWSRSRGKTYMPSFTEVFIFSLVILIGTILLIFDLPYAQDVIYVAAIVAAAGAVLRLIMRKKQVSFKVFVKELFVHDYGFKGFIYILMTGFLLFVITAITYNLVERPFVVYLFGIPGIAFVALGFCGMIYGFIRFYAPLIINMFRNDKK